MMFQSLYPSYKQRSEEFKKLFPTVAESGERLLIGQFQFLSIPSIDELNLCFYLTDYSCALQRDILVQVRNSLVATLHVSIKPIIRTNFPPAFRVVCTYPSIIFVSMLKLSHGKPM
jgi:hypothetical protein